MAHDVAETTLFPVFRAAGRRFRCNSPDSFMVTKSFFLNRVAWPNKPAEIGDDGTNDLLVSEVIRTNELQVWFLSEHVVPEPLVHATRRPE